MASSNGFDADRFQSADLICEDRSLNQVRLSIDVAKQMIAYSGVDGVTNEYAWNEVYQRKDWPGAPIFFIRFGSSEQHWQPGQQRWHLEFDGGRSARLQGTTNNNRPFNIPCLITDVVKRGN
jgi:hypothetical protein